MVVWWWCGGVVVWWACAGDSCGAAAASGAAALRLCRPVAVHPIHWIAHCDTGATVRHTWGGGRCGRGYLALRRCEESAGGTAEMAQCVGELCMVLVENEPDCPARIVGRGGGGVECEHCGQNQGCVRVHHIGWSTLWDDCVPPERIRPPSSRCARLMAEIDALKGLFLTPPTGHVRHNDDPTSERAKVAVGRVVDRAVRQESVDGPMQVMYYLEHIHGSTKSYGDGWYAADGLQASSRLATGAHLTIDTTQRLEGGKEGAIRLRLVGEALWVCLSDWVRFATRDALTTLPSPPVAVKDTFSAHKFDAGAVQAFPVSLFGSIIRCLPLEHARRHRQSGDAEWLRSEIASELSVINCASVLRPRTVQLPQRTETLRGVPGGRPKTIDVHVIPGAQPLIDASDFLRLVARQTKRHPRDTVEALVRSLVVSGVSTDALTLDAKPVLPADLCVLALDTLANSAVLDVTAAARFRSSSAWCWIRDQLADLTDDGAVRTNLAWQASARAPPLAQDAVDPVDNDCGYEPVSWSLVESERGLERITQPVWSAEAESGLPKQKLRTKTDAKYVYALSEKCAYMKNGVNMDDIERALDPTSGHRMEDYVGIGRITDEDHPVLRCHSGTASAFLLYAMRDLPAFTVVGEYAGDILTDVELAERQQMMKDNKTDNYSMVIYETANRSKRSKGATIWTSDRTNELILANDWREDVLDPRQSDCDTTDAPKRRQNLNPVEVISTADGKPHILYVVGEEPVEKGAELLIDYGDDYWMCFRSEHKWSQKLQVVDKALVREQKLRRELERRVEELKTAAHNAVRDERTKKLLAQYNPQPSVNGQASAYSNGSHGKDAAALLNDSSHIDSPAQCEDGASAATVAAAPSPRPASVDVEVQTESKEQVVDTEKHTEKPMALRAPQQLLSLRPRLVPDDAHADADCLDVRADTAARKQRGSPGGINRPAAGEGRETNGSTNIDAKVCTWVWYRTGASSKALNQHLRWIEMSQARRTGNESDGTTHSETACFTNSWLQSYIDEVKEYRSTGTNVFLRRNAVQTCKCILAATVPMDKSETVHRASNCGSRQNLQSQPRFEMNCPEAAVPLRKAEVQPAVAPSRGRQASKNTSNPTISKDQAASNASDLVNEDILETCMLDVQDSSPKKNKRKRSKLNSPEKKDRKLQSRVRDTLAVRDCNAELCGDEQHRSNIDDNDVQIISETGCVNAVSTGLSHDQAIEIDTVGAVCVHLTGYSNSNTKDAHRNILQRLGVSVVDDASCSDLVGMHRVTHVVAPAGVRNRKTVAALATQRWLLRDSWIEACAQMEDLVAETEHGQRRSAATLAGARFFFESSYRKQFEDSIHKMSSLSKLIKFCGGTVVHMGPSDYLLVGDKHDATGAMGARMLTLDAFFSLAGDGVDQNKKFVGSAASTGPIGLKSTAEQIPSCKECNPSQSRKRMRLSTSSSTSAASTESDVSIGDGGVSPTTSVESQAGEELNFSEGVAIGIYIRRNFNVGKSLMPKLFTGRLIKRCGGGADWCMACKIRLVPDCAQHRVLYTDGDQVPSFPTLSPMILPWQHVA